ncbi:hypothetical protein J6590_084100 [Homalodisca vitripennis]|nr:hypothetical protein J6590_084100 [Homalodisca vitripennis]
MCRFPTGETQISSDGLKFNYVADTDTRATPPSSPASPIPDRGNYSAPPPYFSRRRELVRPLLHLLFQTAGTTSASLAFFTPHHGGNMLTVGFQAGRNTAKAMELLDRKRLLEAEKAVTDLKRKKTEPREH